MDFALNPELAALRDAIRAFVEQRILPVEQDLFDEDARGEHTTMRRLQQEARDAGLWTPHLPKDLGGKGLGPMGMAALFRPMGRSFAGPRVFNCDAPDQGNMDLLLSVASDEIRERYLAPLCDAEITSAFCMTEPAPGAGADPSNLRTTARKDGDEWVIDGHKWYSTGGDAASFLIVMARTSDDPRSGASMFVVERDAPGVEHVREIKTMGIPFLAHREAEFKFTNVRVPESAVLGGIGEGFRLAQKRLVPARLTHCMRWLGLADRTLHMCREYVATRKSFGKELARHQQIQMLIARGAMDVHQGNLMTMHCAWMLENGRDKEARPYSSMAKLHVARALCRILDDAIQMHGGLGFSEDVPFSTWYRSARAARIADGPDEVHVMVVARDFLLGRLELLV
ncbi:MAG: acyl-CoA dehydrogenase family protein [Deltaproteobacteria bacterium]|nr:acyl-CoA dehydrogenase family protein [Deltaproteobacteria bacterium]